MELFRLFGTIALNNSEANKGIDETTDRAESASSKFGGALSKIGGVAVKIGAAGAAAVGTVAAGIGAMTKQAVDSYGDYEQLVGGVETLFKGSSKQVMKYANNAYKTAGLSANEYMETVTSFSASLLQSLDGDTKKASKSAHTAIKDMSDNANKMGTDMGSIQNAYQGFAKQNYTMLDNLKLGYGGTKEEMQRLLEDAEKISGQKFDLSSYADIVDAIHVVQTEMGITGTTSKEASTTIQGSIGMMKSAWQNLMTGMADPEQDMGQLLNNFVDSVVTVAGNLAPRLVETVPRLVEGLVQLVEKLTPYISPMLDKLIPTLIEGASHLVVNLAVNLPSLLVTLGTALWNGLQTIFTDIKGKMPSEAQGAFSSISQVFSGAWTFCQTVWHDIGEPIFNIIKKTVSILKKWFHENFGDIGSVVKKIFGEISTFWTENLKPCFDAIGKFIEEKLGPAFEKVFVKIVLPAVKKTFNLIGNLWRNSLKPILTGITDFLTGVFSGDWEKAFTGIKEMLSGIFTGIVTLVKGRMRIMKDTVKNIIDTIKGFFHFEFNVPKIKVPHFKIKPKGWKISDLLDGSIPKLGIDWYAKGGVMTGPTVFGMNGNKAMVGGEKGPEAIAPIETLQKYIAEAVAANNEGMMVLLEKILYAILSLDENMGGNIVTALDNTSIKLNNREFGRMVRKAVTT